MDKCTKHASGFLPVQHNFTAMVVVAAKQASSCLNVLFDLAAVAVVSLTCKGATCFIRTCKYFFSYIIT
jgi:hypothetical protein